MDSLLRVEHVTISYNGKPVVQDVSFELKQGEILGIVGESGSGKSTVIKAIMGLLGEEGLVTEGDIWYKGENLTSMSEKKLRGYLGKEIGMVFQDCKAALCPVRTIGAQIHEAVSEHEKISRQETWKRAGEIMKKIGLDDSERVLNSYPFELSGGMNQRVGICTAMIMHPNLLLADEPTSALDVTVQKQILELLIELKQKELLSFLLICHDLALVQAFCDKVLVLYHGKTVEYGTPDEIINHPKEDYTKRLIDSVL